jgi:hypothetical protein
MIFIHSCQNFTIWHAVLFETWHVLHFCTDGFPRVSRVRRWRYDPYQRVALEGFSTPCVGSTQRRRQPHTTDLWGVRVRALWRSPLQSDRHCSTTPGPRWLVQLEFYLLGIYYPQGRWVSRPQSADGLLWTQPHCGSSLSVRAVSCCESSWPGKAGHTPTRAVVASRATRCHSNASSLSKRGFHTSGAAL